MAAAELNGVADRVVFSTSCTSTTLQTLLATMLDASSTLRFAIETKHPTRYGRYVEDSVAEMLRYFGLVRTNGEEPRARVMSFSRAAVRRIHELLPETADLDVVVVPLPNLRAVNVVVRGLLGRGVADSTSLDPQAKGLAEHLRARHVDIPTTLLGEDAR